MLEPSEAKYELAIHAGTYTYHIIPHNHYFLVWIEEHVLKRNVQTHFPVQEQSANKSIQMFFLSMVH
jgi:hypothetical protein